MDRIYAGSHATMREAAIISPKIANRLKAVHNCIEIDGSPPRTRQNNGGTLSLIYVGRFTPDKGLYSLIGGGIDAMRAGCDVRITTVGPQSDDQGGDSQFFEAMNRLVSEAGANERCFFLPGINNRAQLFEEVDKHDVFCLPSISGETFNMAGLEAMSRAKPLLTSDYGPMPEMVMENVTGFTVAAGDRKAWSEAICRLYQMRQSLPEMGVASWAKARKEFSVEVIADQYLCDFRQLIEDRKKSESGTNC
jgi:glycosyltransferase involved in cell wall biosynthesis